MRHIGTSNIKLITVIIVIIVFMLSSTYAFLEFNKTVNVEGAKASCVNVNYSAQQINTSSLVSTTNYLEGSKSEVTLSKASDCQIYTTASIYIHTNTSTTTAPLNDHPALKYKVLNSSNAILSEGVITTTNGSDVKILTDVKLNETATTYKVYIWVDSTISLGYYNAKTYSGYIYAEAIQSSDVD